MVKSSSAGGSITAGAEVVSISRHLELDCLRNPEKYPLRFYPGFKSA